MYGAGKSRVCIRMVIGVLPQNVMPYSEGFIHPASWDWTFRPIQNKSDKQCLRNIG